MAPCQCWTGTLKNPMKCLWRWKPHCSSAFFFRPSAHLCAVTNRTEIFLNVTLSFQFNQPINQSMKFCEQRHTVHILLRKLYNSLKLISLLNFLSPAFWKRGTLKLIHVSLRLSVSPSVTQTLTLLWSSKVWMIEHWYLVCMILVTSSFYWYYVVTLTLNLPQGQICCRARDHSSLNLLILSCMTLVQCYKSVQRGLTRLDYLVIQILISRCRDTNKERKDQL